MNYLFHDWIGAVHLTAAIAALITGTMILAMKKGTGRHRQIGYLYSGAMVVVVTTAFMIYRLFSGFGIFHIAALVSGVTLAGGMVPALLRKPDTWVVLHFSFMYWSVIGLYAAFVSEMATRLPDDPAFGYKMLIIGTALVMLLGGAWFYYRRDQWEKEFTAEQ